MTNEQMKMLKNMSTFTHKAAKCISRNASTCISETMPSIRPSQAAEVISTGQTIWKPEVFL